jgi:hypothetical protein
MLWTIPWNGMPLKLWNITMSFIITQLQPKDFWSFFLKRLQFEIKCLKLYFINDPTIWQYFCKSNNVHINAKFWVVLLVGRSTIHKLVEGENTLQWTLLGCHMVLLFKDVHVWMYPTSKFWKNFTILLHIMLEYDVSKILYIYIYIYIYIILFFLFLFHFLFICGNKCSVTISSKTQIYSQK